MRSPWRMLREIRRALVAATLMSGGTAILVLAASYFVFQALSIAFDGGGLQPVALLTLLAGAAAVAGGVVAGARQILLARAGVWLGHELGQDVLARGMRLGVPSSRLEEDANAVEAVASLLGDRRLGAVLEAFWTPVLIAVIVVLCPEIGLLACVTAGLLAVLGGIHARRSGSPSLAVVGAEARSRASFAGLAGAAQAAGSSGVADGAARQWERANRSFVANAYSLSASASQVTSIARTVTGLALLMAMMAVAVAVGRGQLDAALSLSLVLVLYRALAPLEQFADLAPDVVTAVRSWRHLKALKSPPASQWTSRMAAPPSGAITLQQASYTRPGWQAATVSDVSLAIGRGQCLAIRGAHGSGRSELAALIAGALKPSSGTVELAGLSVSHWQRLSVWPACGYLAPEPLLIDGTVAENIARFTPANGLAIEEAVRRSGVDTILSNLPRGLETTVGADGRALSLVERRAVALARAFYGSPPFLVLDQPESLFDDAGLANLAQSLREHLDAGTGVVLVTDAARLLALAGASLVMNNGTALAARARTRPFPALALGPSGAMRPAGRPQSGALQQAG